MAIRQVSLCSSSLSSLRGCPSCSRSLRTTSGSSARLFVEDRAKQQRQEAPPANDNTKNEAPTDSKDCEGMFSFMMVKDYACPWWNPDPNTGVWSPNGPYLPQSPLPSLDQRIWLRSEE